MKFSANAIARLKKLEGFRANAYPDGKSASGAQLYSIGYGHQIGLHEHELISQKISIAKGVSLMMADLAPLELQLNRDLKLSPLQNQFDVLGLFGYNVGSGAMAKVVSTWNSTHNTKAVTDQILLYDKTHDNKSGKLVVSPTLVTRRHEDVALFNTSGGGLPKMAVPLIAVGALVGAYMLLT
jgi:GH24 family phage-related lysozyme (muramidase)